MLSRDLAANRRATNSLCGIRQETYLSLGPVARTGYAATGPHPVQGRVLEAMRHHATGDARLEQLAANHGETFSPARWVAVCSEAARSGDTALTRWCEAVMREEFLGLFDHCYSRLAGAA